MKSLSRAGLKISRLNRGNTAFLMCDMQERFRPMTNKFEEIAEVSRRLVLASDVFKCPLLVTEQYPKGLGHTISELLEVAKGAVIHEKTQFSMVVPELEKHLEGIESVVLFGIETHVCITQTSLDLLDRGIGVHLIADATSSRSQVDRHIALARLRECGVVITTAESAMFDLARDKNCPEFKAMLPLVKDVSPDSLLLPDVKKD